MPYVARTVDELPKSPPAQRFKNVRYPPPDVDVDTEDAVTSELGLWEADTNVGGYFSLSYWKSRFNFKKDYNIILHQRDPLTKETRTFVLYESPDFKEASDAFDDIHKTLEPLVDDCTLVLSVGLLQGIIVPCPIDPNNLSHVILELMQSDEDAHPDWVQVLNALTLGALKGENETETALGAILDYVDFNATDMKGNNALHLVASAKKIGSAKHIGKIIAKATDLVFYCSKSLQPERCLLAYHSTYNAFFRD